MSVIKYLIIGIPFAVMFVVLAVLAFGPAFVALREWLRKGGHF
jgi:hypothetical protein